MSSTRKEIRVHKLETKENGIGYRSKHFAGEGSISLEKKFRKSCLVLQKWTAILVQN
jgi:hypothetical protein